MGTLDNVYALNYLVNRQIGQKGGKLVELFIDLKAAFDSVDRRVLKTIRERGIGEELVERVEKVISEMKSRVRIARGVGKDFWTTREFRQGCLLSPMLFNLLITDLKEEMGKIRKRIEEVKEFKYLGYTLQRNGGQEAHVRERIAKAATMISQIWGIGKRRFGKNWKRRVWLYDTLVWTVMGYDVEVWRWKEREGLRECTKDS